jgi:ATP-dependent RNA helicase DHX57
LKLHIPDEVIRVHFAKSPEALPTCPNGVDVVNVIKSDFTVFVTGGGGERGEGEGRKEEGGRRKEEGGRRKEEGGRRKEEGGDTEGTERRDERSEKK